MDNHVKDELERCRQWRIKIGNEEIDKRTRLSDLAQEICRELCAHPERGRDDGKINELLTDAENLRERLHMWTWGIEPKPQMAGPVHRLKYKRYRLDYPLEVLEKFKNETKVCRFCRIEKPVLEGFGLSKCRDAITGEKKEWYSARSMCRDCDTLRQRKSKGIDNPNSPQN